MEVGEEGKKKVELIQEALHQLMEERRKEEKEGMHQDEQGDEETILISKLLSKLDTLEKDDGAVHLPKESSGNEEPLPSAPPDGRDCETRVQVGIDEIMRELRRVKRQNLITHCLLTVMIAVTAFWQFSEVSLLLAVKEKFSNPFRAVGDVIQGTLKGRGKMPAIEAPPLPPVGVPDLPHINLPSITLNSGEESVL